MTIDDDIQRLGLEEAVNTWFKRIQKQHLKPRQRIKEYKKLLSYGKFWFTKFILNLMGNEYLFLARDQKMLKEYDDAIRNYDNAMDYFKKSLDLSGADVQLRTAEEEKRKLMEEKEQKEMEPILKAQKEKLLDEATKKLKDMIQVTERIEIERLRSILKLDEATFNEKLFEWAAQFNFRIDGNYIIVTK